MYFPDWELLPYLKEVDYKVQENANKDMFTRYGPELVAVTTSQVTCDRELRAKFNHALLTKSKDADVQSNAVETVYKEFTRKLE